MPLQLCSSDALPPRYKIYKGKLISTTNYQRQEWGERMYSGQRGTAGAQKDVVYERRLGGVRLFCYQITRCYFGAGFHQFFTE